MEFVVDRIERLISRHKAGLPINPDFITPLEAEGLIYWVRYDGMRERAEMQALLTVMVKR